MGIDQKQKINIRFKVVFSILLFTGILARVGVFTGTLQLHILYSFTNISNTLALICTLMMLYELRRRNGYASATFYRVRVLVVMMMLITGIVYHFVVLPEKIIEYPNYQIFTYGNIISHYIAPVLMFVDWFIFDEKGRLTKKEPFICILVPIIYFVLASIYGYFGPTIPGKTTSYIYYFMDFDQLGVLGVLKWCGLLLMGFMVLIYIIYAIDRHYGKRSNDKMRRY